MRFFLSMLMTTALLGCVEAPGPASGLPDGADTCGKAQLAGKEGTPMGDLTITVENVIRAIPPEEVGQSDGVPSRLTLVVADGALVGAYCG